MRDLRDLSRLITLGLLGLVVVGVVTLVYRKVSRQRVGQHFVTYTMLRDASALPVGSRVMIAGVQVGEIERLSVEGDLARIDLRLRDDVVLWDDATAEKRQSSLFGEAYIEIRPGGPEDPVIDTGGHRRLRSGEPIPQVVEAASTDRMLRALDRAMPRVEQTMQTTEQVLREARRWAGGRAKQRLEDIEDWLETEPVAGPLAATEDVLGRLERWTVEVARSTTGSSARVNRVLDDVAGDVAGTTDTMRTARKGFSEEMTSFRDRLDEVDAWLAEADAALQGYGGAIPPDDPAAPRRNTFGNLVADPELGAVVHDNIEAAAEASASLARVKTWFGARAELGVLTRTPRFYVTAEVSRRPDRFYLVELVKDQLGDRPRVSLSDGVGTASYLRRARIEEKVRFTAQWGKRLDWLQLRFGIKETSFGVGADALLFGGRLRLEGDLFELSGHRVPRLKLMAALQVFRFLYVLGGVDDVLVKDAELPIAQWPLDQDVPIQFERVLYGRDAIVGFVLRFDERDIDSILLLYGAIIGAML